MSKLTGSLTEFLDNKYIPLDKKIKIGIAVSVLLLPLVVFYFVLFNPTNEKLDRMEKNRISLKERLDRAERKAQNLARLQEELDETMIVFEKTAELLPKEQEIPQLLKDISALGSNAGLDFLAFKPGQDQPKDFYAEIPVDINVKGPYHNLGFFLDQVSKLDRIVTVDNIKMGSPTMDTGEMLLASSCRLMTYRFTNVELPKKQKQ